MRKTIFFLATCMLFTLISQGQSVVNASRYFPKADKVQEFEKGLAAHIAKYHSGNWKWRVYEIQTGPFAGGYHVTEGPKHWDEFDKRGNLSTDHMNDWNKSVAPYLTDRYESIFGEYEAELSSVAVGDFTDKIAITHVFPKPGRGPDVADNIGRAQKVWAAANQPVAVYHSVYSGPAQYIIVYRLKDGLKELEDGYRQPWKQRYESVHGEGSISSFANSIRDNTDHSWSELLFFRSDLSAK